MIKRSCILIYFIALISCNSSSKDDQKEHFRKEEENNDSDSLKLNKSNSSINLSLSQLKDAFLNKDSSYDLEWNSLKFLNASNKITDLLTDSTYILNRFSNSTNEYEFKLFYYNDSTLLITQNNNNKVVFLLKLKSSIDCFTSSNIVILPYYIYEDEKNKNQFELRWTNHIFYLKNNSDKILSIGFGTSSEGPDGIGFIGSLDLKLKPEKFAIIEKNRIMNRGNFVYETDSTKILGLNVHYSKNKSEEELKNIDSDGILIDNFKYKLPLGDNLILYHELLLNDSIYEKRNDTYLGFKHLYEYKPRLFISSKSNYVNDRCDPIISIYRFIYLSMP